MLLSTSSVIYCNNLRLLRCNKGNLYIVSISVCVLDCDNIVFDIILGCAFADVNRQLAEIP